MSTFLKKYQTQLVALGTLLAVLVLWYLLADIASANTPTAGTPPVPTTETSWTIRIGQYIGYAILGIASMITYIGGFLLDQSLGYFVLNIRDLIHGSGFNDTLTTMWSLLRDICNLAFIFGFIYVGIKLIIDADDSFTKRQLASIIIGALLINFSLFFVKIVIDVSNYIAVEIYNTLTIAPATSSTGTTQVNIAAKFASLLGISGYFGPPKPDDFANITGAGGLSFYFMGAIMLIVAGFVLAAGAILLVIRFVALVLLMIFSPLLFAATVFPATAHYAEELWHKLFNYSFFAPAYLFLLFLSIKVLEAFSTQINPDGKTLSVGVSTPDSFAVVLNFIVVIMFLILTLQASIKFGIAGGDKALSIGKDLRNRGQRALGSGTFGLGAATMRATIGRGAHLIAESDTVKDAAGNKNGRILGWGARRVLKGSRVVADSSLDARKIGGVGEKLGIGEGRKGGYKTVQEEINKEEAEFARSLGEVDDTDVQVMARKKEWEAAQVTQKAETVRLREEQKHPGTSLARREEIEKEINKYEKVAKDAQNLYEKEKQRRIIGSTYAEEKLSRGDRFDLEMKKADLESEENRLKELWNGNRATGLTAYKDLLNPLGKPDEAAREARRKAIKDKSEQIEDIKKEIFDFKTTKMKDRGYAGVLDASKSRWKTWPLGRLAHMERAAGEEIRKTAEKGLPKKKDE